ncbi:MAG: PolC-type DNA polymerase III, partial [Acidaminococcales bacterium]|nr:PolC-type DNA polymerase III [Acidaminococcales bacterium]
AYARLCGKITNDSYEQNELVLMPRGIILAEKAERLDQAAQKRVELHAHTKMSAMDSVMATESYIKRAALWGHKAAAITDHGVAQAFPEAYAVAKKNGIKAIFGLEGYLIENWEEKSASWHIVILAATQKGLFNLYKLISLSHLQYYYKRPRIPRKVLEEYREGLILGSACEAGELYQALVSKQPDDIVRRIAEFYDYLEIQPNGNNRFLIQKGKVADEEALCRLNRRIVALGKELGKPVVATCDVHFLEPEDSIYRSILQCGQDYENASEQAPLFFRTTDEMLAEFAYLGAKEAHEVVVENPLAIAEKIQMLNPIPDELYAPKLPGAADEVLSVSYKNARRLYGETLPDIVDARLKLELDSIIGNGFSELYLIAHKLVAKSLKDGYPVCSRGSVGSSFVAAMMGITEVNPLLPHYRCPRCFYSEFITDGSYGSGFDLPARKCPACASDLAGDGHNIPFAVFLGFNGDKVPDIDLNFSGDYQAQAHKYTEELFGRSNVFRAGTISTIAEKTAAGFARKYYEEQSMPVRNARIESLLHGCTGVKRTTGQHPGGIMVVPHDMDVHFFTPVQRPADKTASNVITTHFDYHSISDRLVKLDILGHDDPSIIKMLEETTGIAAKAIPFDDPEALSLFSSTDALGVTPQELGTPVGTFGIPEFGTRFVRQMLETLKPKSFNELVRISGYSHGEMVWLKNAEELIKNGTAKTSETIATRDDIMNFLMEKGIDPLVAFKIMEDVRKGNKSNLVAEYQPLLREKQVPEWYVSSCKKISYLFPKAHAAAYVMTACRIAYWKAHRPMEFYAAYFSVRAEDFDADTILAGRQAIKDAISQIEKKGQNATAKEKKLLVVLEIAFEMYLRGIKLQRVNVYHSHPTQFLIAGKDILPPLTALSGLGENLAMKIAQARKAGLFSSKDDLRARSGVSKAIIDALSAHGCLDDMPESNQISLF